MNRRVLVICLLVAFALMYEGPAICEETQESKRLSALTESLQDPDPDVRQASARGLGETKDKAAVAALSQALAGDQDETVRIVALGALLAIGDSSALPAYTKAVKDKSEKVRRSAAEALSGLWDEQAHTALIEALKSDPSPKVRRYAALALGNPGVMGRYSGHNWDSSADTAVALMDALKNDESYEVRATAAAELSKYKVDNVLESLLTALGDKSAAVRAAAAESLGKLDKPQALDRLLELLYFEKDEAVLICALRALKFCDDPRLEQPLVTALGSGSSKVRWQAIDVIEVFKPRSAVEPLRKMLEDEYESEGIRNKAREALDLMGLE